MNLFDTPFFFKTDHTCPLVASAIHAGHIIRPELLKYLQLNEQQRLQEEDPFTDWCLMPFKNQIFVYRSRFELDLNRSRKDCIYQTPQQAWGLTVWKEKIPNTLNEKTLKIYDNFYQQAKMLFDTLVKKHGHFFLFDFHSYNHFRQGPNHAPEDPQKNPDINIGTGNLTNLKWQPLVENLIHELNSTPCFKGLLDVRENIRFTGGYFSKWICEHYPETGCVLAIELKKIFMNEHTGDLNRSHLTSLCKLFKNSIPMIKKYLENL